MPDGSPNMFPAEYLAERLSKQLFSRKGGEGMSALIERLSGHWPDLHTAWLGRRSPDGARALGLVLLRAAQTSDWVDLAACRT